MATPLVWCVSGSRQLGMGHVVRSLRVILELEAQYGCEVYIAGRWEDGADDPLWRRHPLHLQRFTGQEAVPHVDVEWLIDRVRASLVVFDVQLESHRDAAWLAHLRDRKIKVATLHEHVFPWADVALAVSPTIFEQDIESTVAPSRISLQGAPYLLVDAAYGEPPQVKRQAQTVAVVMGGADPSNLRLDIVNRLCRDPRFEGWRIAVVQGPAMCAPDWPADPRIELLEQPGSLVRLFQEASIAITNGGTACYEAIAAGCMVYATPQNDFEDEVIALLITARLCQLWPPIRWEDGRLPPEDRGGIDGRGVSRVAEAIRGLLLI